MDATFPVLISLIAYFLLLLAIGWWTTRGGASLSDFFKAGGKAPWYLVAFGMIGTSISGVTFVSVPGAVASQQFGYMQIVFGYFVGYLVITFILLPLYYRLQLTSIYTYLSQRFGKNTYQIGASFFLLSRSLGSAARLFLVALVLQKLLFGVWEIPFAVSVAILLVMIILYSSKGGIKTIVYTDTFQTAFFLIAVIATIIIISYRLPGTWYETIATSPYNQVFFGDWEKSNFFWKQFLTGALISISMTGLDQDQMQKNLSCRNLADAQKNMLSYSAALVLVNAIFIGLGAFLYAYADFMGIATPKRTDELFPLIAMNYLPQTIGILFLLGLIAAAFSSADGAISALTTSVAVDFFNIQSLSEQKSLTLKRKIYWMVCLVIYFQIIAIYIYESSKSPTVKFSVIQLVLDLATYTYGPLLGLFAFGLFTRYRCVDKWIPWIAVLSPVASFGVQFLSKHWFQYEWGNELLLINAGFTFLGCWITSLKNKLIS